MDVYLYNEPDGGNITYTAGQVTIADELETSAFVSLYGGNELDSGEDRDDAKQWWANFDETDDSLKYRSQTQHLLAALPATSANLRRIEEAAQADLAWMLDEMADSIEVTASIPARNRVAIETQIVVSSGTQYNFTFGSTWTQ
jgi:phage gp46-like protein